MVRFSARVLAALAVLLLATPAAAQRAVFVVRQAEKQSLFAVVPGGNGPPVLLRLSY